MHIFQHVKNVLLGITVPLPDHLVDFVSHARLVYVVSKFCSRYMYASRTLDEEIHNLIVIQWHTFYQF